MKIAFKEKVEAYYDLMSPNEGGFSNRPKNAGFETEPETKEAKAILTQKVNKKSGKKEWVLVSKKDRSKNLRWFGARKPSEDRVKKEERRIQFFKHKG